MSGNEAPTDALITGERVCLRYPREEDRAAFVELWEESWDFLRPWFPKPGSESEGSAEARFDQLMASFDVEEGQRHLVCRREDAVIVGMVNLGQMYRGAFQNCYMGYWVGERYANRGYTTGGVRLALDRAFGELGLHRVEANIIPGNEPSIALVRRLGFREEGFSPRYLKIAGRWQDHLRFALTAEEWEKV